MKIGIHVDRCTAVIPPPFLKTQSAPPEFVFSACQSLSSATLAQETSIQ